MATRPNPTSLKDRSGRLQAFARGQSDSQAGYNAPADKEEVPPKRSSTPHVSGPPHNGSFPTRDEAADNGNGRHQVPRAFQKVLSSSPQNRRSLSPHIKTSQSPARRASPELGSYPHRDDETHRSLFEGSQLGENFMNSGFTTPQNEEEDVYLDRVYGTQAEQRQEARSVKDMEPQRQNHGKRNVPQFNVSDDGRMVVKTGSGRRSPSNMRDGFQNGGLKELRGMYGHGHHRPLSPAARLKNLPIREVKIVKPVPTSKGRPVARERQRSPSPSPGKPRAQHPHDGNQRAPRELIDAEDDDSEAGQDMSQHETPKARKPHAAPQTTLMESSMPPTMSADSLVRTKKRSRASPDYDDVALSAMTYTDLQREPFDLDPAQAAIQNGHAADADSLNKKLDHLRSQPEREQRSFFSAMSMEDWEQSGDWFVDRFADIMNRLRDARRNKRQMIRDFEAEASQREELVRQRSDAVDRKLAKMKQDGQRVVGDRCF